MFARWMIAALAATALASAHAADAPITMKLSTPTPPNDVSVDWMKAFKAGVDARAPGRMKIEIYPASQLGQIPRTIEGVLMNTIELTAVAVGFLNEVEPRYRVFDAPGIFDDIAHSARTLQDPEIRKRFASFGTARNVEPLATFVNGPLVVVSRKPIREIADFKGMKLRIPGPGPLQVEPLKRMGGAPLSMGLGEVLPAVQNRTIDGAMASIAVFTGFKYFDTVKAMTNLPGSWLVVGCLVNRGYMKSLGPELEAIVRDEAHKAAETVVGPRATEDTARDYKTWQSNGGEVINFSAAESKRYLAEVDAVLQPILAANPQMKEDYEALVAAAKRHRR